MKRSKKFNFQINEKSLLNIRIYKKGRRINFNTYLKIKSYLFSKIVLYLILFLIFFVVCLLLINYFLKKRRGIYFNLIEPYIKAQKDFCENNNKYINEK